MYPEGIECVRARLEGAPINPLEELPEYPVAGGWHRGINGRQHIFASPVRLVIEDQGCNRIVLQCLTQHSATCHGALSALISIAELYYDFWPIGQDIVHGRWLSRGIIRYPIAEGIRNNNLGIFARLKRQLVYILGEV